MDSCRILEINNVLWQWGRQANIGNARTPLTLPISYTGQYSSSGSMDYCYNGHVLMVCPDTLTTVAVTGWHVEATAYWISIGY